MFDFWDIIGLSDTARKVLAALVLIIVGTAYFFPNVIPYLIAKAMGF